MANGLSISFILSFLMLAGVIQAQQPSFATRHLSTDQGLPSPEVYDILKDRQGYLWFSTDNGVSRFNGYSFENFGPKQGLLNNVVFFMEEDHAGRIWMPTLSGNVYYFEKDTIYPFAHNHLLQSIKDKYRQLEHFHVDKQGVFHVVLNGLGIMSIWPDGTYKLVSEDVPCGALIFEIEDKFLNVFIPCNRNKEETALGRRQRVTKELRFVFYRDGVQKEHLLFNDQPGEFTGETLIKLRDGRLLGYKRGVIYLFDQDKELIWFQKYPRSISFFAQSRNGSIYISDDRGRGIRLYKSVEAIRQNEFTRLLDGNTVSHVLEVGENELWFSTVNNGVFYVPNQQYEVYNQASGLSDEYVNSIAVKNKSELFLGLHNGDVFRLNSESEALTQFPNDSDGTEVFDLKYERGRDRLWKGSRRLSYWDADHWADVINPYSNINAANKRFNLYPETDLITGASSGSSGFGFVQLSNAKILFHTHNRPALRGRTLATFQDKSGRIWIGRINGFFQYKDSSLVRPPTFPDFFNFRVEDIAQLKDSTIVIGSKGGGVAFWKDTTFFQITESDGLTSSMVENIHIDAGQNIWVGTLNGLNRITMKANGDFSIERRTIADGLPSNEINDVDSWGKDIWVATTKGLVHVPLKTGVSQRNKAPILEEVYINEEVVSIDSPLVLPYFKNHFRIKCLTLNYKLNGKINYRYRLSLDEDWITTQERNINLAALAPGQYEFEIESQNEDGIWSEPARFTFVIRPPVWQTFWFWSLVALFLIGGGLLFYKNRVQQLKKEAQYEKEKVAVERQVLELKQSALRAQMNPHFIFNCLNSIQGFIATGDKKKATRYLAKFAKLIRATLDATLKSSIALKTDMDILENYLEMEQMRFKHKFDYQISVAETISLFDIEIPPLLVQPYVENAIIHGLVEPVEEGKLIIHYEQENGHLKVSVLDNGIGILESKRRKSKQAVKRKPRGMSITRRRLELLDSKVDKNNKVAVEEVKGDDGSVIGTKVTLRIKLE